MWGEACEYLLHAIIWWSWSYITFFKHVHLHVSLLMLLLFTTSIWRLRTEKNVAIAGWWHLVFRRTYMDNTIQWETWAHKIRCLKFSLLREIMSRSKLKFLGWESSLCTLQIITRSSNSWTTMKEARSLLAIQMIATCILFLSAWKIKKFTLFYWSLCLLPCQDHVLEHVTITRLSGFSNWDTLLYLLHFLVDLNFTELCLESRLAYARWSPQRQYRHNHMQ